MSESYDLLGRVVAGLVLLALLGGCLIVADGPSVEILEHEYPDQMDVRQDRSAYVGEQVVIGGFVVETDPVVVATLASGHGHFTLVDVDDRLMNAETPLEVDDRVNTFGTLEDESTLAVDRALTRERSDTGYLFGISLVGVLWIGGRFVRQWRFDSSALGLVPRDGSLIERGGHEDDADGAPRTEAADGGIGSDHERPDRSATDGGDNRG